MAQSATKSRPQDTATQEQAATPEAEPVQEMAVTAPHGFELDESELTALESRSGRKPKDSIYLDDARAAIKTRKAFGIAVTATTKAPSIMGQLRKAEKQLKELGEMPTGATLKKWNREDSTKPFVGFQYIPPEPATAEAAPVQESVTASA